MGRRSNFPRIDKNAYDTPPEVVLPLLPYLHPGTRFIEPCGGKGALTAALEAYSCDIAPRALGIVQRDALDLVGSDLLAVDVIITNPPWSRPVLHQLIAHLRLLRPTWLLFDTNWANTQQAAPLLRFCSHIVVVGRVKWIPGTTMTGKDDAAWFRFGSFEAQPVFIGKPATDRARAASHIPHQHFLSPGAPTKAKHTRRRKRSAEVARYALELHHDEILRVEGKALDARLASMRRDRER